MRQTSERMLQNPIHSAGEIGKRGLALPPTLPHRMWRFTMIHSRIAVLNLGMAANIIALTALVGHAASEVKLASWGGMVPLSIPGAVIGLCLGFAVTLIALHDRVWQHD